MKKISVWKFIIAVAFVSPFMSAHADPIDDYLTNNAQWINSQSTITTLQWVYEQSGWLPNPISVAYPIAEMEADLQAEVDAINEAAIIAAIAAYCAENPSDPDCDF